MANTSCLCLQVALRLYLLGHHLSFQPLLNMLVDLMRSMDVDHEAWPPVAPVPHLGGFPGLIDAAELIGKVLALGCPNVTDAIVNAVVAAINNIDSSYQSVECIEPLIQAFGGAASCPWRVLEASLAAWCREAIRGAPVQDIKALDFLLPAVPNLDHVMALSLAITATTGNALQQHLWAQLQPAITVETITAGTVASRKFLVAAMGNSGLLGMLSTAVPAWDETVLVAVASAVSCECWHACKELLVVLSGAIDVGRLSEQGWVAVTQIFPSALAAAALSNVSVSSSFVHAVWLHSVYSPPTSGGCGLDWDSLEDW
jgi:hypothetical protein